MKYILSAVVLCLLSACSSETIIYYKYNNVVVTRRDQDGRSYFYYGFYDKAGNFPSNCIKAEYPRGTDLMSGYLIFQRNKSVELLIVGDHFSQIGKDTMLRIKEINDNSVFGEWMDSIHNHYNNVALISDALNSERENNKANNSKVEITYK